MDVSQRVLAMGVFLCSLGSTVWGADSVGQERGVWMGTIGTHAVVACFDRSTDDRDASDMPHVSAYFYQRLAKPIQLMPENVSSNRWQEVGRSRSTGTWDIRAKGNELTGTWTSGDSTSTLPINLKRFEGLSYSFHQISCKQWPGGSGVFDTGTYQQRAAEPIKVGKPQVIHQHSYRMLSALGGSVKSVELLEKGPSFERLNHRLRNELTIGIANYYDCASSWAGYTKKKKVKGGGDFSSSIQPVLWTPHWVVFAKSESGYCGGAHPYSEVSYVNWSLDSEKYVDLMTWFQPNETEDGDARGLPEVLNQMIVHQALAQRRAFDPSDTECLETIETSTEYDLHLQEEGMVFTTSFSHAAQACEDDVLIPYDKLMAYLTDEGIKGVKSIRAKP